MELTFVDECNEALTTMETVLVQFPAGNAPPEALDAVFRLAHSIKGSASSLGWTQVASLAHSVEAVLDAMRSQRVAATRGTLDMLLRSVDLLRTLLESGRDDSPVDAQALVDLQLELERRAAENSTSADGRAVDAASTTSIRVMGDVDCVAGGTATIRVDLDLIDSLQAAVAELVRRQGMLETGLARLESGPSPVGDRMGSLRQVVRELERIAGEIRTVQIGTLFRRYPRLVHDLAARLGKQVELRIEGGSTGIDKAIVERVGDALVQLVRNALDHGIERPEARRRAGKPDSGQLWLRAELDGDLVVIEVGEDGAGLARDAIRRKAILRGLAADGAVLTDAEVDALIFHPGLTTVDAPTDISGRGVGMDVVHRNLQSIGASIEVHSEAGHGCRFRLAIPRRAGDGRRAKKFSDLDDVHPSNAAGARR
jgi:two-component system chemotaxis sensor kinase CheA